VKTEQPKGKVSKKNKANKAAVEPAKPKKTGAIKTETTPLEAEVKVVKERFVSTETPEAASVEADYGDYLVAVGVELDALYHESKEKGDWRSMIDYEMLIARNNRQLHYHDRLYRFTHISDTLRVELEDAFTAMDDDEQEAAIYECHSPDWEWSGVTTSLNQSDYLESLTPSRNSISWPKPPLPPPPSPEIKKVKPPLPPGPAPEESRVFTHPHMYAPYEDTSDEDSDDDPAVLQRPFLLPPPPVAMQRPFWLPPPLPNGLVPAQPVVAVPQVLNRILQVRPNAQPVFVVERVYIYSKTEVPVNADLPIMSRVVNRLYDLFSVTPFVHKTESYTLNAKDDGKHSSTLELVGNKRRGWKFGWKRTRKPPRREIEVAGEVILGVGGFPSTICCEIYPDLLHWMGCVEQKLCTRKVLDIEGKLVESFSPAVRYVTTSHPDYERFRSRPDILENTMIYYIQQCVLAYVKHNDGLMVTGSKPSNYLRARCLVSQNSGARTLLGQVTVT
jgi:hypothetical protein